MKKLGLSVLVLTVSLLGGCSNDIKVSSQTDSSTEMFYELSHAEKEMFYNEKVKEYEKILHERDLSQVKVIPSDYETADKDYNGCLNVRTISKQLNWEDKISINPIRESADSPRLTCRNGDKNGYDAIFYFLSFEEVKYELSYINSLFLPNDSSILLHELLTEKKENILHQNTITTGRELFLDNRKVVVIYPDIVEDSTITSQNIKPIQIIFYGIQVLE